MEVRQATNAPIHHAETLKSSTDGVEAAAQSPLPRVRLPARANPETRVDAGAAQKEQLKPVHFRAPGRLGDQRRTAGVHCQKLLVSALGRARDIRHCRMFGSEAPGQQVGVERLLGVAPDYTLEKM